MSRLLHRLHHGPFPRNFVSSTRGGCVRLFTKNAKSEGVKGKAVPLLTAVVGLTGALAIRLHNRSYEPVRANQGSVDSVVVAKEAGSFVEGLPHYTWEEIKRHNNVTDGVWVTYRHGVYDITDFVDRHKGGSEQIMFAAGGAIDPFWDFYGSHMAKSSTLKMLEGMRIGNCEAFVYEYEDYFADDPERPVLPQAFCRRPFICETNAESLRTDYVTPNDNFFIRNHFPVPEIDTASYTLEVVIEGGKSMNFTLDELKSLFKTHVVMTTLQCTGNRGHDGHRLQSEQSKGDFFGLVGQAQWKGVRLRDVLRYAGVADDSRDIRHVQFEGLDTDLTGTSYGTSIPINKAMSVCGDVILAYEMNGKVLPADHGFPLRVIVPGVAGARSVKWLGRIFASKQESQTLWQRVFYKVSAPNETEVNVDYSKKQAIQNLPVQSFITFPKNGAVFQTSNHVTVQGIAYSGGGNGIVRVDVSADDGQTWTTAELVQRPEQEEYRTWGWTFWQATLPVKADDEGSILITCKAVDSSQNTQPKYVRTKESYVNNSWHKISVTLVQ